MINTTEVKEEKRKKEASRLKELGNQVMKLVNMMCVLRTSIQAFRRGEHGLAEEYYTSALLQYACQTIYNVEHFSILDGIETLYFSQTKLRLKYSRGSIRSAMENTDNIPFNLTQGGSGQLQGSYQVEAGQPEDHHCGREGFAGHEGLPEGARHARDC